MPDSLKRSYAESLKNQQKKGQDKDSLLFWLMFCFTTIFLFWAPFQKGLFNGYSISFATPIYYGVIWSAALLALLSIYLFYHWKVNSTADLISVLIWLIPLTFSLSYFTAVSQYYASNQLFIQLVYITFFLIALYISKSYTGAILLQNSIMASSYFIVIFGLFNWLGNNSFIFSLVRWFTLGMGDLPFYQNAVLETRLTSVFQYPNSYAAFLIAILLSALFLVTSSKKRITIVFHSFMVVPIIISFFLTLSRGGLVILPIVVVVVLPLLKPSRQILYVLYLIISFVSSVLVLGKLSNIGLELGKEYQAKLAYTGWSTLLIISFINMLLILSIHNFFSSWLERKLASFSKKRFAKLLIPASAIILGITSIYLLYNDTILTKLLPENVRSRIESINFQQHSVLERGAYYKDAIELFKDYPVLGAGGGAWAALYEKYQNSPYVSRQSHNYFLQNLVETGAIGFIMFIALLGFIFYLFIKHFWGNDDSNKDSHFIFYIISVALLIHSMIDFDLSFVYLGVLLFLSLGSMASVASYEKGQINFVKKPPNYTTKIYPSIVLIISVIVFYHTVQYINAYKLFNTAISNMNNNKNFNEIMNPLNQALKLQPNNPEYQFFKIDLLFQAYSQTKNESYFQEAQSSIKQLELTERHNRILLEKKIQLLTFKDQIQEAIKLVDSQIVDFPWDISLYEKSISMRLDLGDRARLQADDKLKEQYWNQAFDVYNQVQSKANELASLPEGQNQGQAFGLTPVIALSLGQIEFIRGNYESSANFLKAGLSSRLDIPFNRQITRWYLAALRKQNKDDQELLGKLLSHDINEQNEIQSLLDSKF
ncbi:O-antigen ligase family protein [Paenibacillus flagellatus]|nr:O-antigen ligase family protein [Paenibacillus flagellatus]